MAPSTTFVRAVARPFAAPTPFFLANMARPSPAASAASPSTIVRHIATGSRPTAAAAASAAAAAFRRTASRAGSRYSNFYYGQAGRRFQSSAAGADAAHPSWFKRMWDSPIGLKTVHFWAPVMKWALVIAGISDLNRPAEKLSVTQNIALTATGLIWTRWCLIIKPKNYLLAAANFFLGLAGVAQCVRIFFAWRSGKMSEAPAADAAVEEAKQ